jgi:hypothetical protein
MIVMGKVIYMGSVQEPEKVNDTYMKTMHVRTMDRGFTVCVCVCVCLYIYIYIYIYIYTHEG